MGNGCSINNSLHSLWFVERLVIIFTAFLYRDMFAFPSCEQDEEKGAYKQVDTLRGCIYTHGGCFVVSAAIGAAGEDHECCL